MKSKRLLGFLISAMLITGCVTKVVNSDGSVQPTVIDKDKLSETYVNLALEYQRHNAPQVALDRINLAVDANRSNERAFMVRAMIYQQLNKPVEAENDFKKAISLRKEYPDAYVNYASFLCTQKRYDEAMAKFSVALNDPLYFTPEVGYYNRGQCYYQQKRYNEANADFMQSLNYKNPPPDSFVALAKLQYEQKNNLLAKYYIDKYNGSQTAETLWLHIQIIQAILDSGVDPVRTREYNSYRNTMAKVLVDDYGNSQEAQKCIIRYGQPAQLTYGILNSASYVKPKPVAIAPVVNTNNSISASGMMTDANGRRYIMMPRGITVYSLGRQYGLTVKQLEQYNKTHASRMKAGMKVYLDPVNGTSKAHVNVVPPNVAPVAVSAAPSTTIPVATNNNVATQQASEDEPVINNVIESPNSASTISNNTVNTTTSSSEVQQDANGRRYIIVPHGLTAYSISRKYNLTVKQLESYNKMRTAQIITGMKLYIDPR